MKLSVLEQSSLSEGSSAAEAIANTVALSKELDRLGYSRIWVSEHHNLNILQGSTPEVLLAAIGAQTTRMQKRKLGDLEVSAIGLGRMSMSFRAIHRSFGLRFGEREREAEAKRRRERSRSGTTVAEPKAEARRSFGG